MVPPPTGTLCSFEDQMAPSVAPAFIENLRLVRLPVALTQKAALQTTDGDPTRLALMSCLDHTDPLVHAIGQAILGELQTDGLVDALYLESLFRALTIHLVRNHAVSTETPTPVNGKLPPEALQRVRDYIHDHLSEEITLETLAALVHLSPYHFARKFKAATGLPPYQYVLQCRVEQAKSLLVAGQQSISAVAQAVGFASQSHLTRHIKHAFGVTPGALMPVGKNRQK
ncbi:MAG: helix-turn-helix domain-containing protein [Caldilinea sp. CFX5]|nr:helix-turn-helix domain-containing protein [Caldilinea sp. CFX5]